MSFSSSGKVIEKAFQVITALRQRGGVTRPELQNILGCSQSTAQKYLQLASIYLPVVSYNEETRLMSEPIRYFLK